MEEEKLNKLIFAAVEAAFAAREGDDEQSLIARATVAKRLHVDTTTLWRWDKSGYLKCVHIGRAVWYQKKDVEKLERGERPAPDREIE